MSVKRPKILTAVTVPTGGWDLDFTITVTTTLDTPLTATIPAGDYFLAWDAQADDLVGVVAQEMFDAINTAGHGTGRVIETQLTETHRLEVLFLSSNFAGSPQHDVEINWTTSHADLVKALGADGSADQTSTGVDNPTLTLPRHHGFGWYSDEDGQLESMGREDVDEVTASQSRALDGSVKTVQWATRYDNMLSLVWLTEAQTYTDGQSYGDVPANRAYPYNKGLEAWWTHARKGVRFRVYETDTPATRDNDGIEIGTNDVASTTLLRDSTKSWETDPQEWKGMLVVHDREAGRAHRGYIVSHTATALTLNTKPGNGSWDASAAELFTIYDVTYRTYVLDVSKMKRFDPLEIPNLARYNIELPLLRYVA